MTSENVSKKFTFSLCLNSLATSCALYFSLVPLGYNFFLRIHLQPIVLYLGGHLKPILLYPEGKSTKCQILFDSRDSISSSIAFCHMLASTNDKAF